MPRALLIRAAMTKCSVEALETDVDDLSLFVGTANMGLAIPSDLTPWIPPNDFDIYAIGVQVL